jgi:hypothetical protein
VNICTDWDIAKWQVIAWLYIGRRTGLNLCSLYNAIWADDVTLLAISKVK